MHKAKSGVTDNAFANSIQNDIECLQNFADAIQKDFIDPTQAYELYMTKASTAAKEFAKGEDFNNWQTSIYDAMPQLERSAAIYEEQSIVLKAQSKSLSDARGIIAEYNNDCKNLNMTKEKFVEVVNKANPTLGKYLSNLKGASGSFAKYAVSLAGATLKTVGLQIATSALNAVLTMGVSAAIMGAISAFREWYVSADELADKVDEITNAYRNQRDVLNESKKTSEELKPEYEKLSNGVDELGRNVSLTAEEYERYNDISNQLAELFPNLVQGFTDQGTAILTCKNNVDQLTTAYEEALIAANNLVLNSASDIFKDFKNFQKNNENPKLSFKTFFGDEQYGALESLLKSEDLDSAISEYASMIPFIASKLREEGFKQETGWFDSETNNEFVRRLLGDPGSRVQIQAIVDEYNRTVEEETKEAVSIAEAYLSNSLLSRDANGNKYYANITGTLSDIINGITSEFNYDFLKQFESLQDFYNYLDSVLQSLNTLPSDSQVKFDAYFEAKTKLNNGECDIGEYLTAVNQAKNALSAIENEDTRKMMSVTLGLDGAEETIEQYNKLIDFFTQGGMNVEDAKAFVDALSLEDFNLAVNFGESFTKDRIERELQELGKGGSVDLLVRPKVDAKTFTNEEKDIAMNFTPILPNGEVMEENEFKQYCEDVLAGVREDDQNLKIGMTFEGEGAIAQAEAAAEYINLLGQYYFGDFSQYTDEQLLAEIRKMKAEVESEKISISGLLGEDSEFSDQINERLEKINTLREALNSLQSGDFDNQALLDLAMEFPEVMMNTGDIAGYLQGEIQNLIGTEKELVNGTEIATGIFALFEDAINNAATPEDEAALRELLNVILEIAYEAANMPVINIETEKAGLEALKTAIEEARSATGLTQESIDALQNRYKGLATVEDLFIRTSNGIYLNSRAVNDLEEQYLSLEKQKIDAQLEALIDAYDGTDAAILDQIYDLQILQSQYDGLISKYNQWQNAQASANARDPFENVGKSIESIENLISDGWAKSDDVTSWMELVTGKDYSGEDATKIRDDFYKIKELIGDFYTFDKDGDLTNKGIFNFFDLVEEKMPEFVKTLDDGSKYYDLTGDNILKLAEKLGLSAEFIELIARAAEDAGFKVNWDNKFGVDNIDKALKNAENNLKKLNKDTFVLPINFGLESGTEEFEQQNKQIEEQINNLKKQLEEDPNNAQAQALLDYYTAAFNKLNPKPIEETLTEKAKSDLQMLYEMDGKTITINAQFGEQYNAVMQVIAALDTIVKTITIDAEAGSGIETVKSNIEGIGTGISAVQINVELNSESKSSVDSSIGEIGSGLTPVQVSVSLDSTSQSSVNQSISSIGSNLNPVQINVSLDSTSKTSAETEIDSIGENTPDVEIGVGLDSNSKSTVITDINTIGDNAQPVEIAVNVDKTQVTQLDSEVSKQRTANVITVVYKGQLNALGQDVENVPDAEIEANVSRDKWDTLSAEISTPQNADVNITVKIGNEDSFIEVLKQKIQEALSSIGEFFSNLNPFKIPSASADEQKPQVGVTQIYSNGAGQTFGGQENYQSPEDTEFTVEAEVEGQDDLDTMVETVAELQDHEWEAKVTTFGQEELDQMASTSKEITDVGVTATATIVGVEDLRILKSEISTVKGKEVTVKAAVSGTSEVEALAAAIAKVKDTNVSVSATVAGDGNPPAATGTAYVHGTAFKEGNWGTKSSGTALMGELGQELLVRNGRFYTVGDKSAEFVNYKKGDIIFNHEQTKQIFEHGRILYGQKRAHALAGGTAFVTGNAFDNGSFGASNSGVYESYSSLSSGSASKNQKSSGKKGEKDKEEWFDWIEIAIDRIERAIDNLELKATSAFRTWGERTSNLRKQMSLVTDEINLQKRAYDRYIEEANNVGLDAHYAKLVREGAIDIELLKDEDLIEKIKDYQEFYEKALDCAYAVDELNESLSELYQQNFEDVTKRFEDMISLIEHEKSLLEESISQSEEQGYIVSVKYYEALIANEQKNIDKLYEQKAEMQKALSEAIASGTIKQYSEAWYEMSGDINDVTMSIEEAKTEMIEYNNSIRDIEWEIFDLLQEKIGHVIEETEFLVDLLSNEKLHEDSGQLTGEGLAIMGMHGMAYNTYMEQAKRYAKELQEIEKDIANDPNNKDLLERRQELLEAQRDSILAAQDERQEIVDLVEEGIDLELEALEKRIDKYNESLEAAKDLYDYQKKIQESTKEIASLEKQMMAYQGDDSEETKKRVQELKVSLEEARADLEETEYDHYIEDTEKMLDDLYTEYEELLNMRLDDVDTLIKDMIDEINSNSDSINQTLEGLADEFGFELSSILKNSWSGDGNTITVYDSDIMNSITNAATLLSDELQSIDDGIWEMVNAFDKIANSNISTVPSKTTGYVSGAYRISKNQLAWTQEGRNLEAIIRPSDGAILTPLARNDSVLNAHATANLFDFANNPSQFIKENLDLDKVSANVEPKTFVGNTYDNDFAIQIDLPNVTSYGQFVYELQHDPSFERMIKAMTIDKMFGGSSMNKYRY